MVIFYYCIITLLLLADIHVQLVDFIIEPAFYYNIPAYKLSIKPDINLQNYQYSNHTPKFSLANDIANNKCGYWMRVSNNMQAGNGKLLAIILLQVMA